MCSPSNPVYSFKHAFSSAANTVTVPNLMMLLKTSFQFLLQKCPIVSPRFLASQSDMADLARREPVRHPMSHISRGPIPSRKSLYVWSE
jgi:hypothetical protein